MAHDRGGKLVTLIVPSGRPRHPASLTGVGPRSGPYEAGPGHTTRHYEVISPLGKGGMGEVSAQDVRLGRVALKVLRRLPTTR
jgi:hypothetical protein